MNRTIKATFGAKIVTLLSLFVWMIATTSSANAEDKLKLLTLDEETWVTFYDVPSRRFRSVRDKFIQRNFTSAARDLETSIAFLNVEASRAVSELQPALNETILQLDSIRARMESPEITVSDLDGVFARTHWLLAQHFFVQARMARDSGAHKNAGHYLWATAHHIERSILWSNARIDKKTVNALESLRELANRLRESKTPQKVYKDRPLRLAARTIISVGEHLDRTIRINALLEEQVGR